MEYLNVQPGKVFVDGTLGGGGHTHEILRRGGKVIAFDQDPDAIARSSTLLSSYLQSGDLEIHQTNFRSMRCVIRENPLSATDAALKRSLHLTTSLLSQGQPIDGVLLDLGISSHQIDERSRGFSFGGDGPLDMRMHQGDASHLHLDQSSLTAAQIINSWHEDDIANVLYYYGEERFSRRLARAIVNARPINRTTDLEKVLSSQTSFKDRAKTLARCFQALRIRVNDELGALEEALAYMDTCIKPGGRLVIMSYHSLEDRRVKQYLKYGKGALLEGAENEETSASTSMNQKGHNSQWHILTKKAVGPSASEEENNRRSRSAKLRCAELQAEDTNPAGLQAKSHNKQFGAKEMRKRREQST
jgi:16S rRNA (cytosine1402-N4)-methyltransferase